MIYTSVVSKRGFSHPDWNEDNFHITQTESFIAGAVFDGCSTGTDSYFASKLFANVFRQTLVKELDRIELEQFSILVHSFLNNALKAAHTMQLPINELLSTAIIFIYKKDESKLLVKFFGDGAVFINKETNGYEEIKNDELNHPDYIAYSLKEIVRKDKFDQYWQSKRSLQVKSNDFSISTDGIFSFKKMDTSKPSIDVIQYLVQDNFLYRNPASLRRKLNILKNGGYEHEDDVTIIRIINECDKTI